MDIEKLKSIIRLANNNPNDNEANLAARKACKIIAENDFATLKNTFYQPSQAQKDYVNRGSPTGRTKPAAEPEFKSKAYSGPSPFGSGFWEEAFRNVVYNTPDSEKKQPYGPEYVKYESSFTGGQRAGKSDSSTWVLCPKCQRNMYYSAFYNTYSCSSSDCGYTMTMKEYHAYHSNRKPKAKKKCTDCGLEVETFRVHKEPFVCNVCSWKKI